MDRAQKTAEDYNSEFETRAQVDKEVVRLVNTLKRQIIFACLGGPRDGECVCFAEPPKTIAAVGGEYEFRVLVDEAPPGTAVAGYIWSGVQLSGSGAGAISPEVAIAALAKGVERSRLAQAHFWMFRLIHNDQLLSFNTRTSAEGDS